MEEKSERKFNRLLLFIGIGLALVGIIMGFSFPFFAANLKLYISISVMVFSLGLVLIFLSNFFLNKFYGTVISSSFFLAALIVFCFSLEKDAAKSGVSIVPDITVSIENDKSSDLFSSKISFANSEHSNINFEKAESDVDEYEDNLELELLSDTVFVRNNIATLTVKGEPDTLYSIEVYYSSGKSSASGLEEKYSDGEGIVSWQWRIGSRTAPGDYSLYVINQNRRKEIEFSVAEAE